MELITDTAAYAMFYLLLYAPIFYFGGCVLFAGLFPDDG